MRTRIKIPARAMECTHLQFFDLSNYLMMCEKRPVWKCPVCDNLALYSKLIIDQLVFVYYLLSIFFKLLF